MVSWEFYPSHFFEAKSHSFFPPILWRNTWKKNRGRHGGTSAPVFPIQKCTSCHIACERVTCTNNWIVIFILLTIPKYWISACTYPMPVRSNLFYPRSASDRADSCTMHVLLRASGIRYRTGESRWCNTIHVDPYHAPLANQADNMHR